MAQMLLHVKGASCSFPLQAEVEVEAADSPRKKPENKHLAQQLPTSLPGAASDQKESSEPDAV